MSGSKNPILETKEICMNEHSVVDLVAKHFCPKCKAKDLHYDLDFFIETNKYHVKCGNCLEDYTVYMKPHHVTHFKQVEKE